MTLRSLAIAILLFGSSCVWGQSLRITAQTPTGFVAIPDGASVPIQSSGREVNVIFTLTNTASSSIALSQFSIAGTDFSITFGPTLPVSLTANATATFTVRYTPVAGRSSASLVSAGWTESGLPRQTSFTLVGAAPDYTFAITTPDGNRTPAQSGNAINFGSVRPGQSASSYLSVVNRGAAPGTINSITASGRDFLVALSSAQTVAVGQEILVPITFSPQSRGVSTGTLNVDLAGATAAFTLSGTGAAPDLVFAYALRSDGNLRNLSDGGRLTFTPTPATTTSVADVVVVNQGNGSSRVRSITLTGSAFQLTSLPLLPATVDANGTLRFGVQFTPPQLGNYTGSLRIDTDDKSITITVEGTTAVAALTLSYIDPQSRNTLPLANSGSLVFPSTVVNGSATYTVVLSNTGAGTSFVNSVSLQGDAFSLSDLTPLPYTLASGRDFRFGVRFSPRLRQSEAGVLQIETATDTFTIRLSGQGTGPILSIEAADLDGPFQTVPLGSELPFSVAVGQTASKTIRFTNTGDSDASVTALSITGTGFQLANVPLIPLTVAPGTSQSLNVLFQPTQAGVSRGRLRIGDQSLDVSGTGLAPRLDFSYANDAGSTDVATGGTVVLTPARVGESSRISFSVTNGGTTSAVISSVQITPANAQFSLEGSPSLPFTLDPGGQARFNIRFSPENVGSQTAILTVNNASLTLSGNGRDPVAISGYRVDGPSGAQEPLQQPAVSIRLTSPYGLPVRGALTLTFLSEVFSENPAVQFANGGRTASFTIPAGSTQAVFDNGGTEIRLQTGTVAGTIQLHANFTTQAGLALTPASGEDLTMSVARSAPRLLTTAVSSRTRSSLTLVVTGYSTTRNVRQMQINLTPRNGETLSSGQVSASLDSLSLVWFQSVTSQGFGGLFSVEIPLTFQRGEATDDLVSLISSLSVTVSNEVGASNAMSVTP